MKYVRYNFHICHLYNQKKRYAFNEYFQKSFVIITFIDIFLFYIIHIFYINY